MNPSAIHNRLDTICRVAMVTCECGTHVDGWDVYDLMKATGVTTINNDVCCVCYVWWCCVCQYGVFAYQGCVLFPRTLSPLTHSHVTATTTTTTTTV